MKEIKKESASRFCPFFLNIFDRDDSEDDICISYNTTGHQQNSAKTTERTNNKVKVVQK